jgi:hypothetical protein
MINKSLLRCLLILGVVVVFAYPTLNILAGQAAAPKAGKHKVIAYYFHTNTRCSTCIKIEEYSHEAIEKGFPNELKNGTLEMRVINYEQPEHKHYMKDYNLVSKSLVLVNTVNGKQTEWTNLKMVWQLTGKRGEFLKYVRKEIQSYLTKG